MTRTTSVRVLVILVAWSPSRLSSFAFQRRGRRFLEPTPHFRGIGVRKIRPLHHQDVNALLHGVNPCLRAESAAMAKRAR